jgi:competence ComEA-like helix-hairpin-helix protein
VLGLFLALVCAASHSRSEFQTLRVLYTSDLHGRSSPSIDFASVGLPRRELGGWASLLRLIKQERTEATLLLDGGDFGFGSMSGDSSQGRAAVEFMDSAGYDAAVPGPWDFCGGTANFEVLARAASFPILADPMLDIALRRRAPLFRPYFVRDVMGVKVGVIGLADPRIAQLNRREDLNGWTIDGPMDQLSRYLPLVLAESADLTIVIGHISADEGCAIADSFSAVDLVICGGSAGSTGNRMVRSGATPVLIPAAFGQRLGIADILFNKTDRRIYKIEVRMMNVEPGRDGDTSAVAAWLRGTGTQSSDTAVCINPTEYQPDSTDLLRLGALVAEGVRRQAGADIAVLPEYELEGGLAAGRLSREQLFDAVPYCRSVRVVLMDDTTLERLIAPESVDRHEPAPLIAGADYFVTGDTTRWPEISQVARARVRNRQSGPYKVASTEQWLARSGVPLAGRLLPSSLTNLWLDYAAGQDTLSPAGLVRLYPAAPGVARQPTGVLVNVNTAGSELLQTLPGIGPMTAARIIEYRETVGRFGSIEDLQNVKGIGPKRYERLKALVTVR